MKELVVKLFGLDAIRCMGLFWRIKRPDVKSFSFVLYGCRPTLTSLPDTFVAGSVTGVPSHIPVVLTGGGFSKVVDSIVKPVSVYVVDLLRKIAIYPQPDKPVSKLPLPIDTNLVVSIRADATFDNTSRRAWNADKTNEYPVLRVIVKQLADFFWGDSVTLKFSHTHSFQA